MLSNIFGSFSTTHYILGRSQGKSSQFKKAKNLLKETKKKRAKNLFDNNGKLGINGRRKAKKVYRYVEIKQCILE